MQFQLSGGGVQRGQGHRLVVFSNAAAETATAAVSAAYILRAAGRKNLSCSDCSMQGPGLDNVTVSRPLSGVSFQPRVVHDSRVCSIQ